jgi:hypothetical protein
MQFWKGSLRPADAADSAHALKKIRQTLNVFSYLSQPTVNKYFAEICNLIRKEFDRAEQAWVADGNLASGIVDYWDVWIRNHQRYMGTKGLKFIDDQADKLERRWHDKLVSNDDCDRKMASDVLGDHATLKRQRSLVAVKLDKLD